MNYHTGLVGCAWCYLIQVATAFKLMTKEFIDITFRREDSYTSYRLKSAEELEKVRSEMLASGHTIHSEFHWVNRDGNWSNVPMSKDLCPNGHDWSSNGKVKICKRCGLQEKA